MSAVAEPAASREDLLTLIAVLREQNVVLAERCAGLEEQNEHLAVANERLTARVAELERRLDRNSKNSNSPPSQDVFGLPKDESATVAGPNPVARRGKRKGAPGSGLAMVEYPDAVRDHRPGACSDCGEDLRGVPSEGFVRRQVSDVPLATVRVTEHRLHKVRCDCGHLPRPTPLNCSPGHRPPTARTCGPWRSTSSPSSTFPSSAPPNWSRT